MERLKEGRMEEPHRVPSWLNISLWCSVFEATVILKEWELLVGRNQPSEALQDGHNNKKIIISSLKHLSSMDLMAFI